MLNVSTTKKQTNKGTQEFFVGDRNPYYFDFGDGFMDVCLCPNSSKCIY